MTTMQDTLRAQIVRIVLDSVEGELTETELSAAGWSLPNVGYSSLSYIRMIDTVENELGVYLDPEEDGERIASVDDLALLVEERLQEPAGA
jgi:acyl carrier protein